MFIRCRWLISLNARLVAADDCSVRGVLAEPAATSEPVSIDARHLRYFVEDEELFAPQAKPASGLTMVTSIGATLKERKRIVVIRRASSRDTAIPLADEQQGDEANGSTLP